MPHELARGRVVGARDRLRLWAEAEGTVLAVGADGFAVRCGTGSALRVVRCQRPGRRVVSGAELARGEGVSAGTRLE